MSPNSARISTAAVRICVSSPPLHAEQVLEVGGGHPCDHGDERGVVEQNLKPAEPAGGSRIRICFQVREHAARPVGPAGELSDGKPAEYDAERAQGEQCRAEQQAAAGLFQYGRAFEKDPDPITVPTIMAIAVNRLYFFCGCPMAHSSFPFQYVRNHASHAPPPARNRV